MNETTNSATESVVEFHAEWISKKDALAALARQLGIRKDWARQTVKEIRALVQQFSPEQQLAAARELPEFFDEDDLAVLTAPEEAVEDAEVPEEAAAEEEVKPAKPQATPQRAAQPTGAPDVSQVAALLTQLLATGKAGLDADEVRAIVEPMVSEYATSTLDTVSGWIKEAVASIPAREIVVKTERTEVKLSGVQHKHFEELLRMASATGPDGARLNVWLYGPPGTGKTTAARNVAKALDLPFHCNGSLATKYELTGFIDAHGVCHAPEFRKAWENGGVYLFDEIDGSDPKAVVAFNAALANGLMAFPDKMVERHPDCVIVAAANTTGLGATAEFTSRLKLDAATLDRFVFLDWPVDDDLEAAMVPGDAVSRSWLETVRAMRRKLKEKGVRVMVTPRATLYGVSLLKAGMSVERVKAAVLRKGMTDEQWAMVA